jgi:hypothetical protein
MERAGYFHHASNTQCFEDGKSRWTFYSDEDSPLQSLLGGGKMLGAGVHCESTHVELVATSGAAGSDGQGCLRVGNGSVFPSMVAANVVLEAGKWYYEVTVKAVGPHRHVQIGWAGLSFTGREKHAVGVGDDNQSWAFCTDGRKWHKNKGEAYGQSVREGDVVGVAVDLDHSVCSYSLNGSWVLPMGEAFKSVANNIRPAVTLQPNACVAVNFGPGGCFPSEYMYLYTLYNR